MNPSASTVAESSLLLWFLGVFVAVLAAHVMLGWVRQGMHQPSLRAGWRGLLLAGLVFGSGVCSAMVLSLAAEALPFRVGFRWRAVPLLWLGASVAALPALALLSRRQGWIALGISAVWLAAVALVVQSTWIWSVGFRPGVTWRPEFQVSALVVATLGVFAALYLSFMGGGKEGRRRQLWRVGAAALLGLSLVAGQEIVMAGAGLLAQVGAVYHREVPASVLSLLGGVVVPLLLVVMTLDLAMRRRQRKRDLRRHHGRGGTRLETPDQQATRAADSGAPTTMTSPAPPAATS
jgi:NO-binding membrane sensor protein with MHYT domain